jgi:hypothetical protein
MLAGLLLLAGGAHAQLGLRAGVNTTTIATKAVRDSQYASADAKTGYQIGVFYEHKLDARFSVLPELQFSRQRTDLQIDDNSIADGSYQATCLLQISYVHLPVLLRARFGRFYAEAGPQGSLQLAARETGDEEIGTIIGSYRQSFDRLATDHYRRFDVGLCAGLGVQLPAGLALGLRASTGLLSLTPEQPMRRGYDGRQRSQVVQAALSYQLRPRS